MTAAGGSSSGGPEVRPTVSELLTLDTTAIVLDSTCDPPDGITCDTDCTLIECGNGQVEVGEECDPPNTSTCDANCQRVPVSKRIIAGPAVGSTSTRRVATRSAISGSSRRPPRPTTSHPTTRW